VAIGIGKEPVEGILEQEYREDCTLEEATKLAVKCLVKSMQAREEQPKMKLAVVPSETKRFGLVPDEETEKYLQEVLGSGK